MDAQLHKLCGTRHWSHQPCPAEGAPSKLVEPSEKGPATKSTAARKDVLTNRPGRAGSTPASSTTAGDMGESEAKPVAGTQAPPVDTIVSLPKRVGRPRIHPDRKAYKAQKERERRAKLKEAPK